MLINILIFSTNIVNLPQLISKFYFISTGNMEYSYLTKYIKWSKLSLFIKQIGLDIILFRGNFCIRKWSHLLEAYEVLFSVQNLVMVGIF